MDSRIQDALATPATSPEAAADKPEFLFVQTFAEGTWTAKPDEEGAFILALSGASDQTVYFTDRPERIVGAAPTAAFLDGLGFEEDNPPNAALVAQSPAGEEVAVVELYDPIYDAATGDLTYEARLLADYSSDGLAHLAGLAARQADADVPATFGPASLFIDDCADKVLTCVVGGAFKGHIGPVGFCWEWGDFCCHVCRGPDAGGNWEDECNRQFPECGGECIAYSNGCW